MVKKKHLETYYLCVQKQTQLSHKRYWLKRNTALFEFKEIATGTHEIRI